MTHYILIDGPNKDCFYAAVLSLFITFAARITLISGF